MDPAGQRGRLSAGLGPAARTRAASGRQQQRSYRLPRAATLSLSFVVKGGAPSQQQCHARAPSHRHARNPHVGCVSAQPARRTSTHEHSRASTRIHEHSRAFTSIHEHLRAFTSIHEHSRSPEHEHRNTSTGTRAQTRSRTRTWARHQG